MNRKHTLLMSSLLIVALIGNAAQYLHAGDSSDDVKKTLGELNKKFLTALSSGDAAAMVKNYTEKVTLMPANHDAIEGREQAQMFWQAVIDAGVKSATVETKEVEVSGDLAYETGTYKVFGIGQQQLDQGKYLVVWKKEGGTWKTHRDCWNTNEKKNN